MKSHYHIVEPGGRVRLGHYVNRRQAEMHMALIAGRWILFVPRLARACRYCIELTQISEGKT
jgi:hypothetical protein